MTDKNGIELKVGQIVKIEGGYFKADNGIFLVVHAPGNENWTGNDYSLRKCNSKGVESKCVHNLNFWPLSATVNSREKRLAAKAHNKENATIEVLNKIEAYEVNVVQNMGCGENREYKATVTGIEHQKLIDNKWVKVEILKTV